MAKRARSGPSIVQAMRLDAMAEEWRGEIAKLEAERMNLRSRLDRMPSRILEAENKLQALELAAEQARKAAS